MIVITYAHPLEVKGLKKKLINAGLDNKVDWLRFNTDDRGGFGSVSSDYSLILNVGFAGALNQSLALGQVVLVDRLINNEEWQETNLKSRSWHEAQRFAEANGISNSSLLTVDDPIISVQVRDKLRMKSNADIVDMEGHYLFEMLDERASFVSFKIISDNADNDAWNNVKQYGDKWSNVLGETVTEFIAYFLHGNKQKSSRLPTMNSEL